MTLIVARRVNNRIHMVSDSRLTPAITGGRDRQTAFIGSVKLVHLHPGAVIGFANNAENARRAIEGIHLSGVDLFHKVEVLNYLLHHHRNSAQQGEGAVVDFIAAFELDNKDAELFLIKDGEVHWVDSGYIGNVAAYNRFLHHENQLSQGMTDIALPTVLMRAMDAVIRDSDPELENVDGFTVAVRHSQDDGFIYVQRVSVEGNAMPVRPGPNSPVTFGGTRAGANEWQFGSSPGDRFGVLTAYCHTGSLGIIYRPALEFQPRIVRNCTAEQLAYESLVEVREIIALLEQP